MTVSVDLSVLAWFIIFCLAVVIGVFLIILLKNCLKIVEKVNAILDKKRESIEMTLEALPSTVKSVDALAVSAKGTLDKTNSIVDSVEDTISDTIDSFSFNAENILNIINVASSVVKSVINAFSKK